MRKALGKRLVIKEIRLGGDVIKLRRPIVAKIVEEEREGEKIFCLKNEKLNLVGRGRTLEEALEDFYGDFLAMIDAYMYEDEKGSEKRLKKILKFLPHSFVGNLKRRCWHC